MNFTELLNEFVNRAIQSSDTDAHNKKTINKKTIAEKAGLTESALSQHLSGRKNATEQTAAALARALKLGASEKDMLLIAARESAEQSKQAKKTLDGIIAVHAGFPDLVFKECICNATERIWILETWVVNPLRYHDAFIELTKNKISMSDLSIRILCLDPDSEAARQRSRDLWLHHTNVKDENKIADVVPRRIRASIEEFNDLSELAGIEMDIRLNKYQPPFSAHICDNRAFVGFFVHGAQSDTASHLEVLLDIKGKTTEFGSMVLDEFKFLWDLNLMQS